MSNKPYDADFRAASREQEMNESHNHMREKHDAVLQTRAERHRAAEVVNEWPEAEPEVSEERKRAPLWLRILFWLVRKSIAPIIMIVMLLAGLYIGYVIVGGQPKEDVFEWSTWKHMWDLIFAES